MVQVPGKPASGLCRVQKYLTYLVDVGTVSHSTGTRIRCRTIGLLSLIILEFAISELGNCNLDIVPRDQPRTAQANLCNPSTLVFVQEKKVAQPVGRIGEDEDAGKKIRKSVPGRKTEGNPYDVAGNQPTGDINLPGNKNEIQPAADQENLVAISNKGSVMGWTIWKRLGSWAIQFNSSVGA